MATGKTVIMSHGSDRGTCGTLNINREYEQ